MVYSRKLKRYYKSKGLKANAERLSAISKKRSREAARAKKAAARAAEKRARKGAPTPARPYFSHITGRSYASEKKRAAAEKLSEYRRQHPETWRGKIKNQAPTKAEDEFFSYATVVAAGLAPRRRTSGTWFVERLRPNGFDGVYLSQILQDEYFDDISDDDAMFALTGMTIEEYLSDKNA